MKLYQTKASGDLASFTEYASSSDGASKARTRLKKQGLTDIATTEVDVPTTRTELIAWLNSQTGHESSRG